MSTYLRHFGSWCKFLETIGEKCKISKEDLIENYWNLKNKYPNLSLDIVTKNNGSKFHKINYIRHFGSWNKFLETIGEKCRENITKEDLIKKMDRKKRFEKEEPFVEKYEEEFEKHGIERLEIKS